MRRILVLCTAVGFAAVGLFASPANAAWRVIKWDITSVCQIYDFGLDGRPIPSDYRVLTPPLQTFGAALRAKNHLWHQGRCLI